ncbi:hypothetical protein AVEN_187626-1 [Araneus ventricosus]|uniref:Uncharacterized protein n=1 Tax=Araneus ventricosus TaxID=182803 RepID=A0A4Y2MYS3_ARAVE|nr:hypothetical protein AVEN_187626-1 [Araneus ventricosus]
MKEEGSAREMMKFGKTIPAAKLALSDLTIRNMYDLLIFVLGETLLKVSKCNENLLALNDCILFDKHNINGNVFHNESTGSQVPACGPRGSSESVSVVEKLRNDVGDVFKIILSTKAFIFNSILATEKQILLNTTYESDGNSKKGEKIRKFIELLIVPPGVNTRLSTFPESVLDILEIQPPQS